MIHFFLKSVKKTSLYVRGFFLYLSIKACGGICEAIPKVSKGIVFKYPPHKGIHIGKNVSIGPFCIFDIPKGANLNIGNNTTLTANVVIASNYSVDIGNNCLIAEQVSIRDAEHMTNKNILIAKQPLKGSPIKIDDDVWIGKCSLILHGSKLNNGCIAGAYSLIKDKTCESMSIYIGVPAIKIKLRSEE